jgi:hypothetical protein
LDLNGNGKIDSNDTGDSGLEALCATPKIMNQGEVDTNRRGCPKPTPAVRLVVPTANTLDPTVGTDNAG